MTQTLLNNRYQIVQALGAGGFGETFLAEDTQMPSGRRCVIKRLKPVTSDTQIYQLVQERFQREAAILEELGAGCHQIPQLYAYFLEDKNFYLVQEWIEGQTLTKKMQQLGHLSESSVKAILVGLLPVLDYVHSKGIVHRDIKPDNIILRQRDNEPVLIDFGAVRETMGTALNSQGETTSSIVIGTPGFMPSEQAAGRPVYASDLYSLALTAIYLLTGKWPQELPTDRHTGEIVWRPSALSVSPTLAEVLDKAIQPSARDRFPTAKAMLEVLQPVSQVPPTAISHPPTVTYGESTSASSLPIPPTIINSASGTVPATAINSSSGLSTEVPDEIIGWNWGAFLVPQFWAFGNQTWIGLLSWIPILNYVMSFVLASKGNEWAWKSRRWRNIEHFKSYQRGWAIGGIFGSILNLPLWWILSLALLGTMLPPSMKTDQANNSTPTQTTEAEKPSTEKTASPKPVSQLKIEKSVFGKKDPSSDKINPVENSTFKKGDIIAFLLLNVGKFSQGEDGKHSFDMDMEIQDVNGKAIASKQEMLKDEGHTILENDIATSPYAFLDTNRLKLDAGEYKFKLTIYDKISGSKASETATFKIQ